MELLWLLCAIPVVLILGVGLFDLFFSGRITRHRVKNNPR